MKYYVKNRETGDKYIVLNPTPDKEGNPGYLIASVRNRMIIRVSEEHLMKDFEFDGLID